MVETVNGQKVKNLRHLVEVLRDSTDEFLQFRFAEEDAEILVFRRAEIRRKSAADAWVTISLNSLKR